MLHRVVGAWRRHAVHIHLGLLLLLLVRAHPTNRWLSLLKEAPLLLLLVVLLLLWVDAHTTALVVAAGSWVLLLVSAHGIDTTTVSGVAHLICIVWIVSTIVLSLIDWHILAIVQGSHVAVAHWRHVWI